MADIDTLLELQRNDLARLRVERQLQELPEAKQIVECRAKRKTIKGKQDQVIELSDEVEEKLSKLQAEEERVIAKINELQAKLDATSDYRVTKSVTKDMEGQMKRQASISREQDELLERQIKIDKLADQVADMLGKLDHREQHLTEDFKSKGGELKGQIDGFKARHDELVAQLSDVRLGRRYEQLAGEKGGIAVARLEGDHCTACHTTLPAGQLAKLRKGPNLAECPNCQRLLVVRQAES